VPKIKLDKRTGLPTVEESVAKIPKVKGKQAEESSSEEDDDESNDHARGTIKRDPSESKEEKKARKQAVKQERQVSFEKCSATTRETSQANSSSKGSTRRQKSAEGSVFCRA
jgi:protein LTV1